MASQRNLDPHPPLTDIDECQEPMGSPDLHQCDQNCHNNIGSYTCTCNIGWTLDFDGRRCNGKNAPKSYYLKSDPTVSYILQYIYSNHYFCSLSIDVDECLPNGIGRHGDLACQQDCVNTPGSYHCACRTGFNITADGVTCEGGYGLA